MDFVGLILCVFFPQDTNLQTTSGGIPTIQISLQLVGSEVR